MMFPLPQIEESLNLLVGAIGAPLWIWPVGTNRPLSLRKTNLRLTSARRLDYLNGIECHLGFVMPQECSNG